MLLLLALTASNLLLVLVVLLVMAREDRRRQQLEWDLRREITRTQDAVRKHLGMVQAGSSPVA